MRWRDAEEGPENRAQRQERLLTDAVGILLGHREADAVELQRRHGMDLVAEAERAVQGIAEGYRWQSVAHGRSLGFNEAIERLRAVETALGATVAAFDKLGPDALNMMLGLGPMGTQFRHLGWNPQALGLLDPELDFATLVRITGRYAVPDSPSPPAAEVLRDTHCRARESAEELADLRRRLWSHRDLGGAGAADMPEDARARLVQRMDRLERAAPLDGPIPWPEAVAALGELIGTIRRDYEARFHSEVFRLERALEYGPEGGLEPGRQPSAKKARKLERLDGPPSRSADGGGSAKLFELMHGLPIRNFTNSCYECFSQYNERGDISTLLDQPFGLFVIATFKYAIDADAIPGEDDGAGAGTSGLDHHIRNAVSIQEELIELAKRIGRLSEEEAQKLHSLRLAQARGGDEKPIWMTKRPRNKTPRPGRKGESGKVG